MAIGHPCSVHLRRCSTGTTTDRPADGSCVAVLEPNNGGQPIGDEPMSVEGLVSSLGQVHKVPTIALPITTHWTAT